MPAKVKKERKRRDPGSSRKWGFPLGVVIIIFALIGVVSVIFLAVRGVQDLADNSERFAEYETYLSPVVMNDPDPFDDINQAKMPQLLDATIWSLMRSGIGEDDYEYSEGETVGLIVPQEDIEEQFIKLFGEEIKPVHATVSGGTYTFTYDEAQKAYIIPLTGVMPTYTPKVFTREKRGDSVILTVGYLAGSEWSQDEQGNFIQPEPDKYMLITLRERGDSYYISAIQNTDAADIATSERRGNAETTEAPVTVLTAPSAQDTQTVPATAEDTTAAAEE